MDASSPPLSEPGPRRDPRSHRNTGPGAPAPYWLACPPPGDAGQAGYPPGPGPPPAQGRRTGRARATSCHRPSSPHPCAWRGQRAGGRGARRRPPLFVCVPSPPSPAPRLSRLGLPGLCPGGRHVAVPGARPARTLLVALTVAPRLLLQVGACRGCRRPGRPGAGGSAERAYDPQVASHPAKQASRPSAAGETRAPVLPPGCLVGSLPGLPGAPARAGAGRGCRRPPPDWASSGRRRGRGGTPSPPQPRTSRTPPQRPARASIGAKGLPREAERPPGPAR